MSVPSTRACVACRMLKIRCIVDDTSIEKKCQRCKRTNKVCTFPPQQKRKQRKRTDVRVSDLEDQIQSLKSLFDHESIDERSTAKTPASTSSSELHSEDKSGGIVTKGTDGHVSEGWSETQLGNGILSFTTAQRLFDTYNCELITHFPAVIFPADTTVEIVARDKPTLFLAVMAAAARKLQPDIATVLTAQMLQSYTTRAFFQSEKSLELVQAMIVTAIWYCPPEGSTGEGKHKFYEYIHMAATMALDLAPEEAPASSPNTTSSTHTLSENLAVGDDNGSAQLRWQTYEFDRMLLSSYVTCCGVAQSLRRPNLLRFGHQVQKSVERISKHPMATIHDRRLLAWVHLLHIVEVFAKDLSYEELSHVASIDDPQTHAYFRMYEDQLLQWRVGLDKSVFNGLLELTYHHMSIYLHEIALHHDRDPADFKPPYTFKKLYNSKRTSQSAPCINAIFRCVSSAQALIEAFLHMDDDLLRTLPLFGFIRFVYGFIILEMVASPSGNTPYEYAGLLNRESLQIEHHTSLVIRHLQRVVGPSQCRVPSFFLDMMLKLRAWHQQTLRDSNQNASEGSSLQFSTSAPAHIIASASTDISIAHEVNYAGIYDSKKNDETNLGDSLASTSAYGITDRTPSVFTIESAKSPDVQFGVATNDAVTVSQREEKEALESQKVNSLIEDAMLMDFTWPDDFDHGLTDITTWAT